MELVHLECFVALGEELHFGRTAASLHVGTPALSKRISELERQLGVRLFDRTSRVVRLTPAGETLLNQARRALDEIAVLRDMAADAVAGTIGGIRAAYSPGTGEFMTVLTRRLRQPPSGVVVHLERMLSPRVVTAVRSGAVAFGIARLDPGPDLATLVLSESPICAVALPPAHRLATREQITPGDLTSETLLGSLRWLGDLPHHLPTVRTREVDVSSESELFDLVSAGFGLYATTLGVVRRNPRHDVVIRPLVGVTATAKELLMWRPDNDSPILAAIIEVAHALRPELALLAAG